MFVDKDKKCKTRQEIYDKACPGNQIRQDERYEAHNCDYELNNFIEYTQKFLAQDSELLTKRHLTVRGAPLKTILRLEDKDRTH